MDDILVDLSAPVLVTAIKANLLAFLRSLNGSPGVEFSQQAGLIRWRTEIPHPWFNGVLSTRPATEDDSRAVQDALAYFSFHKVGSFTWWLDPGLPPENWARHLLAQGFYYDDNTPGMALDLAALPTLVQGPDGLVIRQVDNLQLLGEWARTFVAGYGLPEAWTTIFYDLFASLDSNLPLRHYLGILDNQPVAASSLYLGAGVAGIYNVATLPEARGQGIGAALTLAPLQDARTMGYRAAILQSSELGYNVYQRLGFREMCRVDHFYWVSNQE
jgi:ribosomal protein S18 acetylase RimI-like enzyme